MKTFEKANDVTYILENENETKEHIGAMCYAYVFDYISEKWKSMLLVENMNRVAYAEPEIKRWVDDLNEMGFPCHLIEVNDQVSIRLVFSEYSSRAHLCSTIQLLRCLWEMGHPSKVPDIYFTIMDANPDADKIEELQNAHKQAGTNTTHSVTGPGLGRDNVGKTLLLERLAQGPKVHDKEHSYGDITGAWRAATAKPKKGYDIYG